ncbi:T7SS effector LXG polymorphic toxin [Staphylococcus simulans]
MGNKVNMQEVNELKKNIDDALENLSSQTKALKKRLDTLGRDSDFKGQTANNVKKYNESYHIETITRIEDINKEFENSFKKSISGFESEVDSDKSAIIVKTALKKYKEDIKKSYENIEENKLKMNSTILRVHDLTSAQSISEYKVKQQGDQFDKHVKETISHFEDFQASHDFDAVDLLGAIYPVVTMSSKVKNLSANRSKIYGVSSKIDAKYKMNSQNNPFTEASNAIKGVQNAAYGGKHMKDLYEGAAKLKNYLIIGLVAGDGDFQKGNELLKNGNFKKMGSQKIKLINSILDTDINNVKGESIKKAYTLLTNKKGNMKMSKKLWEAYKIALNDKPLNLKNVRELEKVKTSDEIKKVKNPKELEALKKSKDYKDVFDTKKKKLIKKFGKSALDSVINPNIQKVIKDPKNVKKYMKMELDDFKDLNKFGKSMKSLKYAGKAFAPVGAVIAVGNNFATEKTMQRKLVGSAVDLGALAGSAGTGTMIGAAIGGPVGAGIGLVSGALIGMATEVKIFNGKSVTDIAKEKANKFVSKFRNSDTWKQTKKGISNVAKSAFNNSPAIKFGQKLSHVF